MKLTPQQLLKFLKDTLDVDESVDEETELFSSGEVDSVSMLQLIAFVENQAGIQIQREEVTLENFDSVNRLMRFVMVKGLHDEQ